MTATKMKFRQGPQHHQHRRHTQLGQAQRSPVLWCIMRRYQMVATMPSAKLLIGTPLSMPHPSLHQSHLASFCSAPMMHSRCTRRQCNLLTSNRVGNDQTSRNRSLSLSLGLSLSQRSRSRIGRRHPSKRRRPLSHLRNDSRRTTSRLRNRGHLRSSLRRHSGLRP